MTILQRDFLFSRFRPLSLDVPKPLFPVAGIPILQHHIEACARSVYRYLRCSVFFNKLHKRNKRSINQSIKVSFSLNKHKF